MTHSYTNKHLIVNGCSFTNGRFDTGSETWANVVRDYFKDTDIMYQNIGWKGNANEVIIPQTLEHIKQIDKNDKVIVIMQLTALDRVVVDGKKSPTIGSMLKSLNWMQWAMSRNESVTKDWQNYFLNEYSEENHIDSFITELLDFQTKIKSYPNVEYKIFCGWDILTQDTGKSDMWSLTEKYTNKNDDLITKLYKNVHDKFKKLNLEKFWFFENKHIHYGGLSQWVQYNVPVAYWYRNIQARDIDYHPSDHAHKEFAEKVMIPLIKEML